MSDTFAWYRDHFPKMILEPIEIGEKVQTYLLRESPESMMMSCFILFTPAGIVITGDIAVSGHGVIAPGYGLGWFTSELSPQYLAEKFLHKAWVPETAIENWKERLQTYEQEWDDWEQEVRENDGSPDQEKPDLFSMAEWRIGAEYFTGNIIGAIRCLLGQPDKFETGELLYDALPIRNGSSVFDAEDLGGMDYRPEEIGCLAAIQRRFSEAYKEFIAIGK